MKKMMGILLSLMMIVNFTVIAEAADFSTGLSGGSSIDAGATFSVDININSSKEIYGITGGLSYDSSKLELVSSEGKNGFTILIGTNVVADGVSPKKGSFTVGTLRFKAKSSFGQGDSTKISLSGVEGSDGLSTLSGSGSSQTISVKVPPKAPAPTKPTEPTKPKAPAESATPKSSNSNLASLSVSSGSISFNKNTTSYDMTVENTVDNLTIQATPEDSKAKVSGTGNKVLSVYGNKANITVTAENGNQKTYTLNVTRKDERGSTVPLSGNGNLSKLEVEGYSLEFAPDTSEYALVVKNHIVELSVSAAAEHGEATVDIKNPKALELGENEIIITVTAENGEKKIYKIIVNREDTASAITMEELKSALENMTVEEVIVLQNDVGIIDEQILQTLKDLGKTLIVRAQDEEGLIRYEWIIDGKTIEDIGAIKTLLSFDSNNQDTIFQAANFAQGLLLSFDHNESLPKGTVIRINVGEHYTEGTPVNLYYYETPESNGETGDEDEGEEDQELPVRDLEAEEPFEARGQYVVDEEGFVTLSLDHTSQYFLTRAVLVEEDEDFGKTSRGIDSSIFIYLSGLQFLAIIGLLVYKLQIRRKRK